MCFVMIFPKSPNMKKAYLNPLRPPVVTAIAFLLLLGSCEDNDRKIILSTVQFSVDRQNMTEGEEGFISISLDRPSPVQGWIDLKLETNAVYDQHYRSDPGPDWRNTIRVLIREGEDAVQVKVTTIQNSTFEDTRFIVLQLVTSDEFRLGTISTMVLTIADDEGPSLAGFINGGSSLDEGNESGLMVEIPFSPARGEGSITVTLDPGEAVLNTHFLIDQEVVDHAFSFNVVKDQRVVSFRVSPVDNDLFTGNFILRFSVSETSGVVRKGSSVEHSLTIIDDEKPSIARFALASITANEADNGGVVVDIPLSSPVKGEGRLAVKVEGGTAVYGTDFTTVPEAVGGKIVFDLSYDQTAVSFTVLPVDNDVQTGDRVLIFVIEEVSGVVWKGPDSVSCDLTIVDDELPAVVNFSASTGEVLETDTDGLELELQFSSPVPGTGTITIKVPEYDETFTTEPQGEIIEGYDSWSYPYRYYAIVLDVPMHTERLPLRILPKDDSKCNAAGMKSLFTIAEVTGAITRGDQVNFSFFRKDEQEPILVSLKEKESTLLENDAVGKEIVLNLSRSPSRDAVIWISLPIYNHYYAGRYTTVPEMDYSSSSGNYAALKVDKGDVSVTFQIFPVNDEIKKEDIVETFSADSHSHDEPDCLSFLDKTFTLTVVDDD